MVRSLLYSISLSVFVWTLVGCTPPATVPKPGVPQSVNVSAPATAKVGQPVELRVVLGIGNCDAFRVFAATDDATKTVTVSAKTMDTSEGGICTSGLDSVTAIVTFMPQSAGTYVVKGGRQDVQVTVTE